MAPRCFADGSELHADGGVAVGVAGDGPFESGVQQRRVLDMETAGFGPVLDLKRGGQKQRRCKRGPCGSPLALLVSRNHDVRGRCAGIHDPRAALLVVVGQSQRLRRGASAPRRSCAVERAPGPRRPGYRTPTRTRASRACRLFPPRRGAPASCRPVASNFMFCATRSRLAMLVHSSENGCCPGCPDRS